MKGKDKVGEAVDTARPYVERIAHDDDLHDHVKKAYDSARRIYDELLGDRGTTGMALRVARDKDLQNELKKAVEELRQAGRHVQGRESHTGRNATLLMTGIALGVLFNPATGPDTRRWLKDRIFGPEQPFEYQSNES
ncbi:MAG TPA: hypothetical protein VML54_02230 [Candidatus Limnocylindrales bacterium]|nr:hypothetical protein [Candidatus Limnocylindrales bacterium]